MSATQALTLQNGRTALDDPVPSSTDTWVDSEHAGAPHTVERDVQRKLLNVPGVHFSSLQVRRLPDGVCLTGIVELPEGKDPGFASLAKNVAGVSQVLNYLVVRKTPKAGSREE